MAKRIKLFYIGWRGNPQLKNGGYYKAYGQLSKTEAKRKENCVYGSMILFSYENEEEYDNEEEYENEEEQKNNLLSDYKNSLKAIRSIFPKAKIYMFCSSGYVEGKKKWKKLSN